jgi:hypothetical protein
MNGFNHLLRLFGFGGNSVTRQAQADGDADGTAAHSVFKKSLKYDSHTLMPSFSILTVLQGQAQ